MMKRSVKYSSKSTGFTLIEMMIAISILAMISVFLYKSLAQLNHSNKFYGQKLQSITDGQKMLNLFYLDLSLVAHNAMKIDNQDREFDHLYFKSSNSIHNRIEPYIAYVVQEKRLYRIESSIELKYPILSDSEMVVDDLGLVENFRLYSTKTHFLLHLKQPAKEEILIKVRKLNER